MTKRTITGRVSIWLSSHSDPRALIDGSDVAVMREISVLGEGTDMSSHGYSRVGFGTVAFECPSQRDLIRNKAEALRMEIQKTRADAEVKASRLTSQLNQLLAIECDGGVL